jgi:hypothetical protein
MNSTFVNRKSKVIVTLALLLAAPAFGYAWPEYGQFPFTWDQELYNWLTVEHESDGSHDMNDFSPAVVEMDWFMEADDFTADATEELQAAVDYAISSGCRKLHVRRRGYPNLGYRITDTIDVGTGTGVIYGLVIEGLGLPHILWDGDPNEPMFDIVSLAESKLFGLWFDANEVAGVTGVYVHCASGLPGQRLKFEQCMFEDCPAYGAHLVQDANATCDFFTFDQCGWVDCGSGIFPQGDIRQIEVRGSAMVYCDYGLNIESGIVRCYDPFFGRSEIADIHLGGTLASVAVFGGHSESHVVMTTGGDANTYSPLIPPILFDHFCQDYWEIPWDPNYPTAIDCNANQFVSFSNCKFVGDVNIGDSVLAVTSVNVNFVHAAFTGLDSTFTGDTEKLVRIGGSTMPGGRALPEYRWTKTIGFDGNWDEEEWLLDIQAPFVGPVTITQISAAVSGEDTPTLTFELEVRAKGSFNSVGSDVFASAQTATAAGIDVIIFADANMPAGSSILFKTGTDAESGVVDALQLTVIGEFLP